MKSIIKKTQAKEIEIKDLIGKEIIAYKCKSIDMKDNYAVLSRLHDNNSPSLYGFVPIGDSTSKPRYVGKSWFQSVEKASENRELKTFENEKELIAAIYNNLF
jgi:hypothetical protein